MNIGRVLKILLFFILLISGTASANMGPKPDIGGLCFLSIPIAILSIVLVNYRINWFNPLIFAFLTFDSIRTPYMLVIPVAFYIGWFVLAWIYSGKNQRTGFNWVFLISLFIPSLIRTSDASEIAAFIFIIYGIWFLIQFLSLEKKDKSKNRDAKNDVAGNQGSGKKSLLPLLRKIVAVIMGIYFISVCFLTISSQKYQWLYYDQRAVMEEMTQISKQLESAKESDARKLYPDEREYNADLQETYPHFRFLSIHEVKNSPGLDVFYKPSPDRKKFILYYNGEVFKKSRWFLLPKGYPQYDSVKGVIPGEREPFF